MKMTRYILIVIFLVFFTSLNYSQQYWIRQNSPTNFNLRKCFFVDSLTGWIAGDSGVIIKTTNGGINWQTQNSQIKSYITTVFFLNKRLGWGMAWDFSGGFYGTIMLKTTNGGTNWDTTQYPISDTYLRTITFQDSLIGYVGGYPLSLLKTTNGGINWFNCPKDSTPISGFPINNFAFYNNKFGFACGGIMDIAGVVWKTTNYGNYWTTYIAASEPVNAIVFQDSLRAIGVCGDYEYGPSIIRTSNAGINWSYTNLGTFGVPTALSFRTQLEGWAPVTYNMTMYMTSDGGNNWKEFATPDSSFIFDLMFTDKRNGYAVGDNGVILKYNTTLIGITNNNNTELPLIPHLYQNYPNPFNPSTNISYEIPDYSYVILKIYNNLGQEIRTLYNGFQKKGNYNIKYLENSLPSGVYYYKLIIKGLNSNKEFSETKKMLLIK